MSLHANIVAIEGNRLTSITRFFEDCDYALESTEQLPTRAACAKLNNQPSSGTMVIKAAYYDNGWTVLLDPEMTVATNEKQLSVFAHRLAGRICSIVCAGASDTYLFALYDQDGHIVRAIETYDGYLARNEGEPLAEEAGLDLSHFAEEENILLLKRIAVDYDGFQAERNYTVYTLRETMISGPPVANDEIEPRKTWWKLW